MEWPASLTPHSHWAPPMIIVEALIIIIFMTGLFRNYASKIKTNVTTKIKDAVCGLFPLYHCWLLKNTKNFNRNMHVFNVSRCKYICKLNFSYFQKIYMRCKFVVFFNIFVLSITRNDSKRCIQLHMEESHRIEALYWCSLIYLVGGLVQYSNGQNRCSNSWHVLATPNNIFV